MLLGPDPFYNEPRVPSGPPGAVEIALSNYGAEAAEALPLVSRMVADMSKATIMTTLTKLRHGELTPEGALQAWHEIESFNRLLKRFQATVTTGDLVRKTAPTAEEK